MYVVEAHCNADGTINWDKTNATTEYLNGYKNLHVSEKNCHLCKTKNSESYEYDRDDVGKTQSHDNQIDNQMQRASAVTIGTFDGVHCGHRRVLDKLLEIAHRNNEKSVVMLFEQSPKLVLQHQSIVQQQKMQQGTINAQEKNAQLHTEQICTPDKKSSVYEDITSVHQRLEILSSMGIEEVIVLRFTPEFMRQTYTVFLNDLVCHLHMKTLVLGEDVRLGWEGEGTGEKITAYAHSTGEFNVCLVDLHGPGFAEIPRTEGIKTGEGNTKNSDENIIKHSNINDNNAKESPTYSVRVWSSSNIRYLLSQGRIKEVTSILGHYPCIEGEVVSGEKEGRKLGFPTANISEYSEGFIPADGVYAGWLVDCGQEHSDTQERDDNNKEYSNDSNTECDDKEHKDKERNNKECSKKYDNTVKMGDNAGKNRECYRYSLYRPQVIYPAAISVGTKPTFHGNMGRRVVEAYALTSEWIELYGHHVRLMFFDRIRSQERFENIDKLIAQMKIDVANVQEEIADIAHDNRSRYLG